MFEKVDKKVIDKAVKEANAKLKSVQEEIDRINQEKERQLQETFKPVLVEWMKANPSVKEVMWTQFTPYFNDGEECEFEVNDLFVRLPRFEREYKNNKGEMVKYDPADYDVEDDESEGYYSIDYGYLNEGGYGYLIKPLSVLQGQLHSNQELLRHVFGDHARIRVSQTEVIVEEFEHH